MSDKLHFWMRSISMCVMYLSVGPALIVLNKHILQTLDFAYPVTLSSLGQIFIAIVTHLIVWSGRATISDEAKEQVSGYGWVSCMFVGLFKALTLSFGNAVYLHLNMGYIQMLKAFSPVLMLFLLVVTGVEGMPKPAIILSVLWIAFFTIATTVVEESATWTGLLYMALAQGTEAMAIVLTQFLLKKKKMTIVESQYYLAPPAVFWFCIIACFGGEWFQIYINGHTSIVRAYPFRFMLAATLGLIVNYLTFAVIKATSGTMLKVLGTARNVIAVVVGAVAYNEIIPFHEWACYSCTVCVV